MGSKINIINTSGKRLQKKPGINKTNLSSDGQSLAIESTYFAGSVGGGVATPKIGSFFSTQTQSATTINTPKAMTLNNADAFSSGISIVSNSQITVDTAGIYNLQFSAQVDRVTTSGVDKIEIWFRKQGVDIPNSTTKVTVSGSANQAKLVASWNIYLSLTAGQHVELMYSVTDLQVQLVAEAENLVVPYPATPSLIVTMQKIN
jgi:hypothetical protein